MKIACEPRTERIALVGSAGGARYSAHECRTWYGTGVVPQRFTTPLSPFGDRGAFIVEKGVRTPVTEEFGFSEMQDMQARLQEKYRDIWEPISPQTGKNKLLWLMIELGEAADIIKKDGAQSIIEDEAVRAHFVEELADIMMYYNDVMLCFGISVDELKETYREKHQKNMHRW